MMRHVYSSTVVPVSYHYKYLTKRVGLAQSSHQYHLIKCSLFLYDIAGNIAFFQKLLSYVMSIIILFRKDTDR
jgi:hypothetical protein